MSVVVLAHELRGIGMEVERQKPVPIIYRGINFGEEHLKDGIKRLANRLKETP